MPRVDQKRAGGCTLEGYDHKWAIPRRSSAGHGESGPNSGAQGTQESCHPKTYPYGGDSFSCHPKTASTVSSDTQEQSFLAVRVKQGPGMRSYLLWSCA
eukprot:2877904-Amphidinium_carterae.1